MKKQKAKAATKRGVVLESVVGRLVVLQSEDPKDPMKEVPETASIEGTFDTMDQAEQFIRADTHEYFPIESCHEGRNDDRTAPIYICQVVRVVKAVPICSMRVTIEEANTPNTVVQPTSQSPTRLSAERN